MSELQVFSPYDEQLIDSVSQADAEAVETMLACAQQAYLDRDNWLAAHRRIAVLERAVVIMDECKDKLALTAAREGGKPLLDSQVEIERAILGVKTAIAHIPQMTGQEIPMNISLSSANRMAYTYREPVGVVFAISAFNHPLNLIIHQVIAALAVGCPVIVKPASSTPLSCLHLVDILYQAGLPKQWCQVLICENSLAEHVVSDPRVSFLSFIGSGKVGWYLRTKLAPGAHCALEHGGAAPVIVAADADLDDALPLLIKGGFYHAGQVCVSVQRVFVHQKISKQFAKNFSDLARALIVGDPCDDKTEVGPLISPQEVNRVHKWVQQATQHGAKLLCGGEPLSATCYQPTVLLDPPYDINVSTHEIFGPVVCIYSYKDRHDAIIQANKPPFCFQGAVFTKDIDIALDTVRRLNATAVMLNDSTSFRVDWMPFGGRKHSGLAMGGIPYSMHDMSYEKMMVVRSDVL